MLPGDEVAVAGRPCELAGRELAVSRLTIISSLPLSFAAPSAGLTVSLYTCFGLAWISDTSTHEKVGQDTAGAPRMSIRPALDSTFLLVIDENGPRLDHVALRVVQPACDAGYYAAASRFKHQQGIVGGSNEPVERWGHLLGLSVVCHLEMTVHTRGEGECGGRVWRRGSVGCVVAVCSVAGEVVKD